MDKAEAEGGVVIVRGGDRRHAVGVAGDRDPRPSAHAPRSGRWSAARTSAGRDSTRRRATSTNATKPARSSGSCPHPTLPRAGGWEWADTRRAASTARVRAGSGRGRRRDRGPGSRVGGSAKADNFIGLPASLSGPVIGSSTAINMLRAAVCGWAKAWAMLLTGPHGTPAASSTAIQCSVLSVAQHAFDLGLQAS